MTNIASLSTRLARIGKQVAKSYKPKTWAFVLLGDEPIPADKQAKIGPHDTVYVKHIYLCGLEQSMI